VNVKKIRCFGCGQVVEVPVEVPPKPFTCACGYVTKFQRAPSTRVLKNPQAPKAGAAAAIGGRGLSIVIGVSVAFGLAVLWVGYRSWSSLSEHEKQLEEGIPVTAEELSNLRQAVCVTCMRRFPKPHHYYNHMHEKHPEEMNPSRPAFPMPPPQD
jgi:hypothetical protein